MSSFTEAWSAAFEGIPADNENINLGANRIRALKVDLRERMSVDHSWDDGLSAASNDGKHNQVTLRSQSLAPTLDTGDGAIYTHVINSVTEAFYKDSAGNITQLTSGGTVNISATLGNLLVNGQLTTTLGAVIDGNLSVAGTALLESNATVQGNLAVTGTSAFTGAASFSTINASGAVATGPLTVNGAEAVSGDLTVTGRIVAPGGVGPISSDANFFLKVVGGNDQLAMNAPGTFLQYNGAMARFEFWIGGVLISHIP